MDKKELRRIHIKKLADMPQDARRVSDERIARRVMQDAHYIAADSVFIYVSVGEEVSTRAILSDALERGKRVYVPVCEKGGVMHARRLLNRESLVPGMYGIPTAPEGGEVISPDRLDCILVPGVCFDREGSRLGRGGGYYDRYLEKASGAYLIGICRGVQLVERLYSQPHDRRVHTVISDAE